MPYFNESQLEQSIITLLQEQGYDYVKGEDIQRDLDEVVLRDDLAQYLRNRYRNDGITDTEVEAAIRVIMQQQGGTLYDENKQTLNLLMNSFPEPLFYFYLVVSKKNRNFALKVGEVVNSAPPSSHLI